MIHFLVVKLTFSTFPIFSRNSYKIENFHQFFNFWRPVEINSNFSMWNSHDAENYVHQASRA